MAALGPLLLVTACGVSSTPFFPRDLGGDGGSLCASDRDCNVVNPRCDKNSSTCVPCLPQGDNCPVGKRCVTTNGTYACTSSCVTGADCQRGGGGATLVCCGGACIDSATDSDNCGACGMKCPALANAASVCKGGSCARGDCRPGFEDCDNLTANGCEVAFKTDPKHCGMCRNACPAGANQTASCTDGTCLATCAAGFDDCDKMAPNGCEIATATDVMNCGACGMACGKVANGTAGCAAGACTAALCDPGFGDCNKVFGDGCEAALAADVMNCGACGKACPVLAHAVAACKGGACGIASCEAGFADCDGLPGNGCETDVGSDAQNCGACGARCAGPNSVQGCAMGACVITMCSPAFADCDGKAVTGCEASTATDVMNCGGCGKTCPAPPNGTPSCVNAMCGLGGCQPGFADCNFAPNDGCEADLASPQTCGRCGNACPLPQNASPGCRAGVCGIGACLVGYADCDAQSGNGCERNTTTDPLHCGRCNNACFFANGVAQCLGGACALAACNANFGNCDNQQANGCEASLNTDPKNCGACGLLCGANTPSCVAGKCVSLLYAPVGPQTNVPVANLAGWTQCYLDTYGTGAVSLAQIQATCSKAKLMLACRPTNSQTLTLLGWAPRADVLFNIGDASNVPHNANGIGWYYSTGASWGFALQGDVINRNTCDVKASSIDATGNNGNLRLCYHTSGTNLTGGWRCGATDTLNASGLYQRVIYHAD